MIYIRVFSRIATPGNLSETEKSPGRAAGKEVLYAECNRSKLRFFPVEGAVAPCGACLIAPGL